MDANREYFNLINPKYIDWDFYEGYIEEEPNFTQVGLITFLRTYSRFVEELGRREFWREVCLRVVEYSLSLDTVSSEEWKREEARNLFKAMFMLKGFTAGRTLWTGGTEQTKRDPSSGWNCCFRALNSISSFSEIFYWLMIGAGTGFSVEKVNIEKLPQFRHVRIKHCDYFQKPKDVRTEDTIISSFFRANTRLVLNKSHLCIEDKEYITELKKIEDKIIYIDIGDSKEGWCNALRSYLHICSFPNIVEEIVFNYDNIRPAGERIKIFGGRSSGYTVLKELFTDISKVLQERLGEKKGSLTSVDFLDIVNIIGLGVVSGGVRRCLPQGTLIHLKAGLKKIEDVKVGDLVATSKGYYPVTDWVYQGTQSLTEIKTQLGKFECTSKHKIAVISDTKGSYIWKTAEELIVGDRMVFVKNTLLGQKTELPDFKYDKPKNSTTCKDIIVPEFTEDIAYLLGYLHGNGYVRHTDSSGEISFAICANHVNILKKLIDTIQLFGVNYSLQEPSINDNCFKLRIKSKQLALYFSSFKMAKTPLNIPSKILNGLEKIRINYIAGLSDADGCYKNHPYIIVHSVYFDFVKQLQCLIASLGIPTCLKERRKNHENWQTGYELILKGVSSINDFKKKIAPYVLKFEESHNNSRSNNDFGFPRDLVFQDNIKYDKTWNKDSAQMTVSRLEYFTGKEVTLIPIEVLEINHNVRTDLTYDISVDSVNEFVCDSGYLVHNTAQISLGDEWDIEFKEAKNNLWTDEAKSEKRKYRVMSNNSVLLYKKPDLTSLKHIFEVLKTQGDPGIWIIENSNKLAESPVMGTNPCFTGDMKLLTVEGYKTFEELEGQEPQIINKNGDISKSKVWSSGFKECLELRLSNKEKIKCTPEHLWLTIEGEFEAKDLKNKQLLPFLKSPDLNETYIRYGFIQGDANLTRLNYKEHKGLDVNIGYKDEDILELFLGLEYSKHGNRVIYLTDREDIKKIKELKFKTVPLLNRTLPENFNSLTLKDKASFLNGCFSANGSVLSCGRITYKSICRQLVEEIQEVLLHCFNIDSYITTNKEKEVEFSNGVYTCKESFDLNINRYTEKIKFFNNIGFYQKYKLLKLSKTLIENSPYVTSIKSIEIHKVYDFTEPLTNWGVVNGYIAHNCAEAALDDGQTCNLTTTNVFGFVYWDGFENKYKLDKLGLINTVSLVTRVGLRQTLANQWHPYWDEMQKRDRLLGVSLTGVQDTFDILNYTEEDKREFYEKLKSTSVLAANLYADKLKINHSTRVTLIKPEGTISLLPSVSSGIHKSYAPYFLRRIRFSKNDPLCQALYYLGLSPNPENGQGEDIHGEKCNTWVYTFPMKSNSRKRAIDYTAEEQLQEYLLAQKHYCDRGHNASFTCTLRPEEYEKIPNFIFNNWEDIIGVSFLPTFDPELDKEACYPQLPFESCSMDKYFEEKGKLEKFTEAELINLVSTIEREYEEYGLDSDCNGKGFCPSR